MKRVILDESVEECRDLLNRLGPFGHVPISDSLPRHCGTKKDGIPWSNSGDILPFTKEVVAEQVVCPEDVINPHRIGNLTSIVEAKLETPPSVVSAEMLEDVLHRHPP